MKHDEILGMAREAKCGHESMTLDWIAPDGIYAVVDAILERAAVECDMAALFVDCDKEADGAMLCGTNIRALKAQGNLNADHNTESGGGGGMNNLTDLLTEVASRIWDCMAEHEDKCDWELEDAPLDHPLWEIVSILTEFVK